MKTDIATRIVIQPHTRSYPVNAFSLAVSDNDGQLAFGLLDVEDSKTLIAEGRLFLTFEGIKVLYELLGRSLEQIAARQKSERTLQ